MCDCDCGNNIKYGLTVDNDGEFILNGKPFYGYGLNIYSAFQGLLYPEAVFHILPEKYIRTTLQ